MNEHRWGKKFKEEANDILFDDLRFDERLKARVRETIGSEKERQGQNQGLAKRDVTSQTTVVEREIGQGETVPSRHVENVAWGADELSAVSVSWQEADRAQASADHATSQATERPDTRARRRKLSRTVYGVAIAASVILAVTMSYSSLFEGQGKGSTLVTEVVNSGNPELGGKFADDNETEVSIFVTTDDLEYEGLGGTHTGDTGSALSEATEEASIGNVMLIELASLDQARQWFGEDLLVPRTIPAGYELERITVEMAAREADDQLDVELMGSEMDRSRVSTSERRQEAIQWLHLYYASETGSMMLTERRISSSADAQGSTSVAGEMVEYVDLEESTGYMEHVDGELQLRWTIGEIELMLVGTLEREVMLQVARSVEVLHDDKFGGNVHEKDESES